MNTFKDISIQIMLNKSIVGKAPPTWDGGDWQRYYKSFKRTALTPHVMAAQIWQGYGFTPCYTGGRRLESNFDAAYHMAFDFDNISGLYKSHQKRDVDAIMDCIESIDFVDPTGYFEYEITDIDEYKGVAWQYGTNRHTLDYLMRPNTFADLFSSFAYSTPSSTEDHPKSRVVFIIPQGITDPQTFRQLYQAIAAEFEREGSTTDKACKDPLRLYYGSERCDMRTNWAALLPPNIEWLIERYAIENPPPRKLVDNTVKYVTDGNAIQHRVENELNKIINAPDGEKHRILNKAAFTVGGFVGAGHLSESDAIGQLERAIESNGRSDNLDAAYKTIRTAVQRGAAAPLVIENKMKKPLNDRLK